MLDGQGNDMENKTFNIGDIVKDIWAGRLAIVVEVCEPWTWDDEGLDFHRFTELDYLAMGTMCEEDAEEWDRYSDFHGDERWTRERHGDKGLKLCRFGDSRTFYAPQDTWRLKSYVKRVSRVAQPPCASHHNVLHYRCRKERESLCLELLTKFVFKTSSPTH